MQKINKSHSEYQNFVKMFNLKDKGCAEDEFKSLVNKGRTVSDY